MSSHVRLLVVTALLTFMPVTDALSNLVQITNSPGTDMWPTWTPDGQWLIFSSNRTGSYRLYKVPANGGVQQQISFGPGDDNFPAVSPDGTKIAFSRVSGDELYTSVWVMPIAGGAAVQVSTPSFIPGDLDWYSEWSLDGQTLSFGRREGFEINDWGLFQVPANGGPSTVYLELPFAQINPVLSNDGSQIAYGGRLLEYPAPYNVFVSPVNNPANVTQLTSQPKNTVPNDYSPDGSKLLYVSRGTTGWAELYEYDLGTQASTRITFDSNLLQSDSGNQHGQYSPDGSEIAHYSLRSGNYDIWVLNADTTPPEVCLECPPRRHERVMVGQQFVLSFPFCNCGTETTTYSWCVSDEAGWGAQDCGSIVLDPGECHAVTLMRTAATRPQRGGQNTFTFRLAFGGLEEVCEVVIPARNSMTSIHGPSGPLALGPNSPNPFSGRTSGTLSVSETSTVSIKIFNAQGQLVRTLGENMVVAEGGTSWEWDGLDSHGSRVSSGIYYLAAETPSESQTLRLMLVR